MFYCVFLIYNGGMNSLSLFLSLSLSLYIYIYRERERERDEDSICYLMLSGNISFRNLKVNLLHCIATK